MKKYRVVVWGGLVTIGYDFISNSRNAKNHIYETGADKCEIYTMNDKQISAATRDENGNAVNVLF